MDLDLSAENLDFQGRILAFLDTNLIQELPAAGRLVTSVSMARQRLDEIAITAMGLYATVDQLSAREPGSNLVSIGPGGWHDGHAALS